MISSILLNTDTQPALDWLAEVKMLATNVNSVVSDNKTRIDGIASNLESTSVNFKEFSEDIKQHPWKLLMKGK